MNDPDKPEEEFYPFEDPEELEVISESKVVSQEAWDHLKQLAIPVENEADKSGVDLAEDRARMFHFFMMISEPADNDPTPEEEEELAAEALDLYEAEHGL